MVPTKPFDADQVLVLPWTLMIPLVLTLPWVLTSQVLYLLQILIPQVLALWGLILQVLTLHALTFQVLTLQSKPPRYNPSLPYGPNVALTLPFMPFLGGSRGEAGRGVSGNEVTTQLLSGPLSLSHLSPSECGTVW